VVFNQGSRAYGILGETVKVSIVISVLNSHEVLRRQLLHFERMNLPDDVELIIIDDGSEPPLEGNIKNLTMHATHDTRPWTQPIARNIGARMAKGEYLICTDIDHILSRELIDFVRATDYDVIRFRREAGVLNEDGTFTQDMSILKEYGYIKQRLSMSPHGNSYAIKKELFEKFGGSQQRTRYPNRDEQKIKRWIHKLGDEIKVLKEDGRPTIYMIPNGRFCGEKDYNPFGLFHNLTRKFDDGL
jgi:glycosyltransferase involved in cell wall biosynthesis